MRILSVQVGPVRTIMLDGEPITTGIFKQPVRTAVRARRHHLEGDAQADTKNHGGETKAVYAYPIEHYAFWQTELERQDLVHGQFGENLTTCGLLESELVIGTEIEVGTAVLEVTQPRKPCFKLGVRMRDPGFVKRFLVAGRPGFYLRVLEEGDLWAGAAMRIRHIPNHAISVTDIWRLCLAGESDPDLARAALQLPYLSREWMSRLEKLT